MEHRNVLDQPVAGPPIALSDLDRPEPPSQLSMQAAILQYVCYLILVLYQFSCFPIGLANWLPDLIIDDACCLMCYKV